MDDCKSAGHGRHGGAKDRSVCIEDRSRGLLFVAWPEKRVWECGRRLVIRGSASSRLGLSEADVLSFDSGLVGFLNSQVPKGEGPDPRQSKFLRAHPSLEESEGWGTHCCGRVQISKNLGCATRQNARNGWGARGFSIPLSPRVRDRTPASRASCEPTLRKKREGWGTLSCGDGQVFKTAGCATRRPKLWGWSSF